MRWMPVFPVGLPSLAVLAVGFLGFLAALLIARGRRAPEAAEGQRAPASLLWIIVQGIGIGIAGFGPIEVELDPASLPAIVQAAAVALLMTGAIWLFAAASRAMGPNWAIVAQTRGDHELVTTGPFARIRNPIYVALFLFLVALAVAYGHYWHLLLAVPVYALGTMRRVRIEERLLRARFGVTYDAYAARVRRFVPGVV